MNGLKVLINDEWRRWVSENLLLGNDAASIHGVMLAAGISSEVAQLEIDAALHSPYLHGAKRLSARMLKRDWILESISKLKRMDPQSFTVARRHRLSRAEFISEYYSQNKAVIITGMLEDWPAMKLWNLNYFQEKYGERNVEVQFGRNSDPNYELNNPKHKRMMPFGGYVDSIRSAGVTNDFYMTANNSGQNSKAVAELWNDITQIPEYLDGRDPNAGFFWLGPAGTITPFHHDLTNNFMAQVLGRKRILLIPASELPRTYNNLHCFTPVDGRNIDFEKYPALKDAIIQEVILSPGEILFLPVGHWHFVEALDISCTMTFTNFIFDNDFSSFYHTYDEL